MQTLNNEESSPAHVETKSALSDSKAATIDYKSRMQGRFMTVTDSYFNRGGSKVVDPTMDIEKMKNHYKFHKGTTYTIGKMGDKTQ